MKKVSKRKPIKVFKYPMNNVWGEAIYFHKTFWEIFTSGFTPKVNDEILAKMTSGKTALFRIIEVDTPNDPGDQSFVKTVFVGYIKEEDK